MADNEKQLRVGIDFAKTGEGDQQAKLSLDEMQSKARELKTILKDESDAHEEAGDAAEKHEEKIEGLNAVFKMLGRETVPELTHVLHGLEMGQLGYVVAAFAAVEVCKALVEKIDEVDKKLAEQTEGFAEAHAQMIELITSYGEYISKVDHAVTSEERLATALKNQADERKAIAEIEARTRHAAEGAEAAEIEADFAGGRINASQHGIRLADAQARAEVAEHKAAEQLALGQIADLQKELADRQANAPGLASAADEAQSQFIAANNLKTKSGGTIKELQARIEAAEKSLKNTEYYLKLGMFPNAEGTMVPLSDADREKFEQDKAGLEDTLNGDKGLQNQLAKQRKINETPVSEEELNRAKKDETANRTAIANLPAQIAQAIKLAELAKVGNVNQEGSDIQKLLADFMSKNRGANIGGGVTAGFVFDVQRAQHDEAEYSKLTAEQRFKLPDQAKAIHTQNQQLIREFGQLMNVQMSHDAEVRRFIVTFMAHKKDATQQLQDLRRQIDFLGGRN